MEKRGWLKEWQCGFRKKQGTLDVLHRFEHTIKKTFLSYNQTCVVVYIDLKSAFDTVWPTGLVFKLSKMGMRGNLLRWINDYFKERTSTIFVEGHKSSSVFISNGTPQGAVLSPLLFNLMMTDMPEDDDIQLYVYADDVTLSCSGCNVQLIKDKLQTYLNRFDEWCNRWGLILSPTKTTMQWYGKKKIICPILRIRNNVIEYKRNQRILGLIFDSPNLIWKSHIESVKIDCFKRINLMKTLSSTSWGCATSFLRTFYISYIRSKIDYGSNIYGSASKTNLKILDSIQNSCLRLILGCRKSTPILSLESESYLPPLNIHRRYLEAKTCIKYKCLNKDLATARILDLNSPVANNPTNAFVHRSLKSFRAFHIPRIPLNSFTYIAKPPWIDYGRYIVAECDVNTNCDFARYLTDQYNGYIQYYTDGSKLISNEIALSAAAAIYSPSESISIAWRLRSEHSVITCELFAILEALKHISKKSLVKRNIICTDSLSALHLLQRESFSYNNIVNQIQKLLLDLNNNGTTILHWVRAHCGIAGNEIADKTAKLGHENDRIELFPLSYTELTSLLKINIREIWNEHWRATSQMQNKGMFLCNIKEDLRAPSVGDLRCRRDEVVIHRLRTGHVGLN